jgi:DNA-directed RNA polymerase specialized sigma24 family protein
LGGNNLASYADVSSAVDKLPADYYNLIVWRYKYQRTFDQIAAETDVDRTTAFRRHERAVKAIQALLGQQPLSEFRKGYDGRTEATGNAHANARTERDYEG